jgi:hypothetical protein
MLYYYKPNKGIRMKKAWIKGYEGLYEITDHGNITRYYKNHSRPVTLVQDRAGYLIVSLSKESKVRSHKVHRLVAQTFLDNPENKSMVDHIDEDKTNNRVDNLRWCTGKENTEYYNTKDGRRYHIELARKRKEKLKVYENQLKELRESLKEKQKEIEKEKKEVNKLKNALIKKEEQLEIQKLTIKKYLTEEIKRLDKKKVYDGYKDTKGVTFSSVDEMVKVTGKSIKINGIEFESCGAAASYIVKEELATGKVRNKGTISKELRRYLQGKRPSWKMYGRYEVA